MTRPEVGARAMRMLKVRLASSSSSDPASIIAMRRDLVVALVADATRKPATPPAPARRGRQPSPWREYMMRVVLVLSSLAWLSSSTGRSDLTGFIGAFMFVVCIVLGVPGEVRR